MTLSSISVTAASLGELATQMALFGGYDQNGRMIFCLVSYMLRLSSMIWIWMAFFWVSFIAMVFLYNQEFLVFSVLSLIQAFLLWKAWPVPVKETKE